MKSRTLILILLLSCSSPPVAQPKRVLRDFRGIIHCHSKYSHDSKGAYEEILAAAKAAKVDFVCMTDHPPKDDPGRPLREGWKGLHDGVLFIQGAELKQNILALGIKEPVEADGRQGKIDAIHAQGGLAFVCHPEEVKDWSAFEGCDGMEIYNVHATVTRKMNLKFIAEAQKILKEDPEHSYTLLQELDEQILKKWNELNRKRRVVGIAGNDAHQNTKFGGMQLDPYERCFKFVSTHVLAEELTEDAILKALREGRCYVAFDLLGDLREFRPQGRGPGADLCVEKPFGDKNHPWLVFNPPALDWAFLMK